MGSSGMLKLSDPLMCVGPLASKDTARPRVCKARSMHLIPSAETQMSTFRLSPIAASLLIITQSKKGLSEGRQPAHTHTLTHTHTHIHTHTPGSLTSRPSSADALQNFKAMILEEQRPLPLAVTRLVQALGSNGDVEGIRSVESLVKSFSKAINLSSMLFISNTALAHIKK